MVSLTRIAGLAPLLLAACSGADAGTHLVGSNSELAAAIKSAKAGDEIQLAPGSYGPLVIAGIRHERPVRISGKDATLKVLEIRDSAGWTVDGLYITSAPTAKGRVALVERSSNISLQNNLFEGLTPNKDPWDDWTMGIQLRDSTDSRIVRNRFRDLGTATSVSTSSGIRFEGNSVAYVREGVQWVSVNDGVIRCNRFSHFYPNWLRSEHPDGIQGWWRTKPNSNGLLVEGNFLSFGGPRAIQGIFLSGAYQPTGDLEFGRLRNVTVRDNIYYGSSLHGVSLSGTENVVIERNTVLPSPHAERAPALQRSADGRRSSALLPVVRVRGDVSTGRVFGNLSAGYLIATPVQADNNLKLALRGKDGVPWKKVFLSPPSGDDPPLESFRVDPASEAGRKGQGARLVCGDMLPPGIDAPSRPDPSGYTGEPGE
jgi:hypothetical protein